MNDFMGDVGCSSHVVYYNAETVCDVFPFDTELIVMIFFSYLIIYTVHTEQFKGFLWFGLHFLFLILTSWFHLTNVFQKISIHLKPWNHTLILKPLPILVKSFNNPLSEAYLLLVCSSQYLFSKMKENQCYWSTLLLKKPCWNC